MISVPIFLNMPLIFALTYPISKPVRLSYEDAAPAATVAGSKCLGVAVAAATTIFDLLSGAALAAIVSALT
jgi:ACR3 family arsenite transporter